MFKTAFDKSVCDGDTITCTVDGVDYTARLEHDHDRRAEDSECYTPQQIAAWRADEWHFYGVVISAQKNGVPVGDHLASLWGIEGNFPDGDNGYFLFLSNELLPEAITGAQATITDMLAKLAA